MLVIVRAFEGCPLKREVIWSDRQHVYLVNPEMIEALERGETHPIGFPTEDVFIYTSESYDTLMRIWNNIGSVPDATWQQLDCYRP